MRKPYGMPVLLVLAVILLLSGCTADPGVGLRDEGGDNAAAHTAAATALLEEAVERREAIVNTSTEIVWSETFTPGETYTGTAYYVSNQGDDRNDGLSPETAWATLDRVNQASLEYGDAVFFERGSVWRNTTVETKEGVTYSAYGEGAKPRICASPENGGDSTLWSLWWEGENGEKIWLYHRDMPDCGAIVLNEEIVAQKVLGYWSGKEFLHYIGPANWTPDEFDLEEQLSQAPLRCDNGADGKPDLLLQSGQHPARYPARLSHRLGMGWTHPRGGAVLPL